VPGHRAARTSGALLYYANDLVEGFVRVTPGEIRGLERTVLWQIAVARTMDGPFFRVFLPRRLRE
jgi:hypothetical protein